MLNVMAVNDPYPYVPWNNPHGKLPMLHVFALLYVYTVPINIYTYNISLAWL